MISDMHVHSSFSADSNEDMAQTLAVAQALGMKEICFTDHYDWDFPLGRNWVCDLDGIQAETARLNAVQDDVRVAFGVEMGVRLEPGVIAESERILSAYPFDNVVASVHLVQGVDPYFPDYFDGLTRQEGFSRYVETLYACLRQTDFYTIAGHIDYPSKGCPYDDKRFRYEDAPDVLDALFRLVIEKGKAIEINTSVLKKLGGQSQDMAIYKRYVELGGEYVSFGSDAHKKGDLGFRFAEAVEFARAAGIRYYATFEAMRPILHRL